MSLLVPALKFALFQNLLLLPFVVVLIDIFKENFEVYMSSKTLWLIFLEGKQLCCLALVLVSSGIRGEEGGIVF